MLKAFGLIFISLILGWIVVGLSSTIGTNFPLEYAKDSSIGVLATILALNVATATFLIGSLLSIESDLGKTHFKNTRNELQQNIIVMAVTFVLNIIVVITSQLGNNSFVIMNIDIKTVSIILVFAILFFNVYLLIEVVLASFKIRTPELSDKK
jgi:hypothetical protein